MANGQFTVDEKGTIFEGLKAFVQNQERLAQENRKKSTEELGNILQAFGLAERPKDILESRTKGILQKAEQLNPLQENVLKAVQKVHKQNVEEAMAQGASGEEILKDAGVSIAKDQPKDEEGKPDSTSLALAGVQPPELTGQQPQFKIVAASNPLSPGGFTQDAQGNLTFEKQGFLSSFGGINAISQEVAAIAAGQKFTGTEKIQMKEILKLKADLIKAGSVDALKPESAGKFNLLIEGAQATTSISNMLNSNVTAQLFAQGVPTFLKSQQARLLESAIEVAVQDRTRIETGAALQPTELKSTAKRFMPVKGDSLRTALTRLKPLNDFFEGSLRVADPTGVHRQRARGQTQAGTIQVTNIKSIKQVK